MAGSHNNVPYRLETPLPLADIKIEPVGGFGRRLDALLKGEVEAASLLDPQIYMAEELGLRKILGGEFNTLWWVDESSERDVLRRYFAALARADAAIDRDLVRYLPLWMKCVPPEFADRPWRVEQWGPGERFVFAPYPAEELVVADDRGDPKESVTLTRRLAQTDRVLMIYGSISSSSAGVMFPLSQSLKVPIITPTAAAPGLTDKFRPWAYTMNPGAARALGTGLAALRKHHPNVKKATILYNQADAISTAEATRVMPGTFQGAGIELLDSITFQTGDLDFSAQVTRALASQPDRLCLGSGCREAALIAK